MDTRHIGEWRVSKYRRARVNGGTWSAQRQVSLRHLNLGQRRQGHGRRFRPKAGARTLSFKPLRRAEGAISGASPARSASVRARSRISSRRVDDKVPLYRGERKRPAARTGVPAPIALSADSLTGSRRRSSGLLRDCVGNAPQASFPRFRKNRSPRWRAQIEALRPCQGGELNIADEGVARLEAKADRKLSQTYTKWCPAEGPGGAPSERQLRRLRRRPASRVHALAGAIAASPRTATSSAASAFPRAEHLISAR